MAELSHVSESETMSVFGSCRTESNSFLFLTTDRIFAAVKDRKVVPLRGCPTRFRVGKKKWGLEWLEMRMPKFDEKQPIEKKHYEQ